MRIKALAVGIALMAAACGARTIPPPAVATADKYPDFIYPAVPPALQRAPGAERIEIGWRFLQSGDTRNAGRDFDEALKQNPQLYPARAGEGYVALARGDHEHALTAFDAALTVWKSLQMVTNVQAKGPVPSFAPPYVPVGPVVMGDNIAGPHFLQ